MDGLNKQEIEYRQNNGMVNNENIKNSRTVKQIILSNTITLFNILNLTLLVLVLTTGSFINTTFVFTIIFNTLISIFQEIKAKKIIDKLSIGKHTLKVVFSDGGQATTIFNVAKTTVPVENPNTLDNVMIYIVSGILSIIGITGTITFYKRKQKN